MHCLHPHVQDRTAHHSRRANGLRFTCAAKCSGAASGEARFSQPLLPIAKVIRINSFKLVSRYCSNTYIVVYH